jgi:uncharacterized LabA/DUF88 family protein
VSRVAILIDGSNFLAQLDRCGLGYPALGPLISWIRAADELVYARFYSAPQLIEPFQSRWYMFRAANRHVAALDFFQGYRDAANREKAIDVALAVDLVYGCAHNHFDRVAIVGGDADHHYAVKVARSMRRRVKVWLMPAQPSGNLAAEKIAFHRMSFSDLLSRGIADRGAQAGVPIAHRAPPGCADVTARLTGAFGNPV